MILTRTFLNTRRQGAKKLVGSPQAMHAAILSGFPPGVAAGRALWRVDPSDPLRPTLFVVSEERPDFVHLEEQAGWPTHPTTVSANYDTFLDQLAVGQVWAFRLTANPTHRLTQNMEKKIVAHVREEHQLAWLLGRAETLGASFGSSGEPSVMVAGSEMKRFNRKGTAVTLGMTTFTGRLRVEEPSMLRQALTQGIGRAKAYGCGLMTLAEP